MDKIQELQQQIDELNKEIESLKNSSLFPLAMQETIRQRLGSGLKNTNAKTVASETVTYGGTGTFDVTKLYDGFKEVVMEDGTRVYLPYYLLA